MFLAGVDGCWSGWLCLTLDTNSGAITPCVLRAIDRLLTLYPTPDLVMIDVPIGLPDAGPRQCDREARKYLRRPRASSVFPVPIRPVLRTTAYPEACGIGQQVDGRKLTKQTWAILPKVREVDLFIRSDPRRQEWIREVHPEVSFAAWNKGRAMAHGKKTTAGKAERKALVRKRYGTADRSVRSGLPRGHCKDDDVLDAFAALWTCERAMVGEAISLPNEVIHDAVGLRMEIVV